jgi:hypothetical protein
VDFSYFDKANRAGMMLAAEGSAIAFDPRTSLTTAEIAV